MAYPKHIEATSQQPPIDLVVLRTSRLTLTDSLTESHSTHLTESKSTQPKKQFPKKKPWIKKGEEKCPWPCKFCKEVGLNEYHWQNVCPNRNKSQEKLEDAQAHASGTSSYTNLSVIKSKPFDRVSSVLIPVYIGHFKIKAFLDTGSNVNLISLDFAQYMKMSLDRSRSSLIRSIAGQVTSPGVVSFNLTINKVTKTIEACVLNFFQWMLLLSLPTQDDFDITIKTRQRIQPLLLSHSSGGT